MGRCFSELVVLRPFRAGRTRGAGAGGEETTVPSVKRES
jgi:hypothetical protein